MINDDLTLLREYSRYNSEEAFATRRLAPHQLLKSIPSSLRQVRDPHLAEEITQAAFIILARKADSLGDKTILPGWLCRTARYTSANALTIQRRRQQREHEAHMQTTLSEAAGEPPFDETWKQIAPLLDGALGQLAQKDHDALVLRFFQNKSLREVGEAIGASEDAAKMCASTARWKNSAEFFSARRGVTSTTAIIAGVISGNSVHAAPVALAKSVSVTAIAKGSIAAPSTLTLIKATMKTMTWFKIKFAAGIGAMALLIAGTTTIALSGDSSSSGSNGTPAAGSRQVLLVTAFFKAPASKSAAIIEELSAADAPNHPNSMAFRAWLKKHPEADFLGSPQVLTVAGQAAKMSITKPEKVNGTNFDTAIILNVTPAVHPGRKIGLKISAKFREFVNEVTIRTTKQDEQEIQSLKPGVWTLVAQPKIENNNPASSDVDENLLVFAQAMLVTDQVFPVKKTQ